MRRRLLLTAAAVTAAAVPLAIADGADTKAVQAHQAATAAPTRPSGYAQARRNGQPIALLAGSTRLRATPGGRPVATVPGHTEWGAPTVLAATAERNGWLRVIAAQLPNGARGWIPDSAVTTVLASPWKLEADLSRRLMTVRREGHAVRRFRVAVGKPSTPTPTGRFAITDKLDFTSRSAAYGPGAIALTGHQTHIEPGWKGGTRLAIHGTADQASIGQAASSGCLRARDSDVRWLVRHAYLGSIVEIRP